MTLEIIDRFEAAKRAKETPMWTSDRRLYLNADRSKALEEGHPDAAFLLVAPGQEITEEEAIRLGLKQAEKPANKAAKPPANKAAKPPATK
jgi:hypothetical protein